MQSRTQAPAHYSAGIKVGHQMQVYETVIYCFYICYVAYPYLIGRGRDNAGYQIGVLVHPMVAPCSTHRSMAAAMKQRIAFQ